MTVKYFYIPFALSGDQTAIPDPADIDNFVSLTEGWTSDYDLDQDVDVDAKDILRDKHNWLFNKITSNDQQYFQNGFPPWITAADNNGSNYAYGLYAIVKYSNGSYYRSIVAANTGEPTIDTDKWELWTGTGTQASTTVVGISRYATDTEAVNKAVTAAAITPSNLAALNSSTTFKGFVELATNAEVQTGTDTSRAITPSGLSSRTASTTATGIVELATVAEAEAGTSTTLAVTPAGLAGAITNQFPTNTQILAVQSSAPTGWTKVTDFNNQAIRIVSGAAAGGGSVDFTTAFTSQTPTGSISVGGTATTTAQTASHDHIPTAAIFNANPRSVNLSQGGGTQDVGQDPNLQQGTGAINYTESTGSGNTHTHSGSFTGDAMNFAVKYRDVIIIKAN